MHIAGNIMLAATSNEAQEFLITCTPIENNQTC